MGQIETFTWQVEAGGSGDEQSTVRTAQFGEGYRQTSSDGMNSSRESWGVSHTGTIERVLEIRDFLRSHAGRSFLWRNPLGELGLYQAPARNMRVIARNVATITATFEQAFHP